MDIIIFHWWTELRSICHHYFCHADANLPDDDDDDDANDDDDSDDDKNDNDDDDDDIARWST